MNRQHQRGSRGHRRGHTPQVLEKLLAARVRQGHARRNELIDRSGGWPAAAPYSWWDRQSGRTASEKRKEGEGHRWSLRRHERRRRAERSQSRVTGHNSGGELSHKSAPKGPRQGAEAMSRGRVTRPLGENTGRAWACPLGTASATRCWHLRVVAVWLRRARFVMRNRT